MPKPITYDLAMRELAKMLGDADWKLREGLAKAFEQATPEHSMPVLVEIDGVIYTHRVKPPHA